VKRILPLFLGVVLLLAFAPTAGKASGSGVLTITIDGMISPIEEEYLGRAIDQASAQNSSALIVNLRTPGGLMIPMNAMVTKILASKVPVIVYVNPSGSRAASAGFFILESADVAAMAPGTNTGASHPVPALGGKIDDVMKTKIENDAAASLRSFVSKRGRNTQLAETAVRESKSWTDQEALDQHLIEIVATDTQDLLKKLEGREITRFNGEKVTLHIAGQPVTEYPMSLRQNILNWLMDPNILLVLLAIGALCIYVEFNHPGAVIPGVVGALAILLAIFALNLLPTRYAAVGLILAAFVLFALEAKFTSHGVLTIGGIVAMTLGGLLLVDGPIPEMRVKLITALGVSIPMGVITVFLMTIALKARQNKVVSGPQGLVGEVGITRTALSPLGKVFVHGELWDALAPHAVELGQKVRVTAVEDLRLTVEPVDVPSPASSEPSFETNARN
jgi:membrane-bound serine protease (ClpP class)